MNNHIIYHGDVLKGLEKIDDRSVACIITSPPYHDLKQYSDNSNEIGYSQTYDQYINSLINVFENSQRVLDYNCRLFINLGHIFRSPTKTSPYHMINIGADIISRLKNSEYYYNWTIRWNKITTSNVKGGGGIMGSKLYPRNSYPFVNHELIHIFTRYHSKYKNYRRKVLLEDKEASKFTIEDRRLWVSTQWEMRGVSQKKGHIAVFPDELPRRIMKFSTFRGETVLDLFGGCYDDITEILTKDGFKLFSDINRNTLIATEDENGVLIYKKPKRVVNYHYKGDMYKFKTSHVDLLVTPDHNMYGMKKRMKDWEFTKPDKITSGYKMRRITKWIGKNNKTFELVKYNIPIKNWLSFMAIWLSDGHIDHTDGYRIAITEKKESVLYRKLLNRLPFGKWSEHERENGTIRFYISNKILHSYLEQFGKSHDKFIPTNILELSSELIDYFLEYYSKADGMYHGKSRRFFTVSKKLASDLHIAIIKTGYAGYVLIRQPRVSYIKNRKISSPHLQYVITESRVHLTPQFVSEKFGNQRSIVQYDGTVHCVEIDPTHLLYVRRNGKAIWCGNSGTVLKVANEEGRKGIMCEMGWNVENGDWLQDITLPKINSSDVKVIEV